MSRWTVKTLARKSHHDAHPAKFGGVLVTVTWETGKVECGKLFANNGREVVRIHNSGKVYDSFQLREHGRTLAVRA